MTVPKYHEFYIPILNALKDENSILLKDLKPLVAKEFGLSESELTEMLPSGRQTVFSNRINWALTYLKKSGLIESIPRAKYNITKEGLKVLKEKPNGFNDDYLVENYESFRKFKNISSEEEKSDTRKDGDTPDDLLEDSFKKINEALADELLDEVLKLSPRSFEKLVIDLLLKMGYGNFENAAQITQQTRDKGIDGKIKMDKLGFDMIYIQAKRYDQNTHIDVRKIREFKSAVLDLGGQNGVFVTTSDFTKDAKKSADKDKHIILIDGNQLAKYMIEHNFGVYTEKTFKIKKIDVDIFNNYNDEEISNQK